MESRGDLVLCITLEVEAHVSPTVARPVRYTFTLKHTLAADYQILSES